MIGGGKRSATIIERQPFFLLRNGAAFPVARWHAPWHAGASKRHDGAGEVALAGGFHFRVAMAPQEWKPPLTGSFGVPLSSPAGLEYSRAPAFI